jgi:hypothetical protein
MRESLRASELDLTASQGTMMRAGSGCLAVPEARNDEAIRTVVRLTLLLYSVAVKCIGHVSLIRNYIIAVIKTGRGFMSSARCRPRSVTELRARAAGPTIVSNLQPHQCLCFI